MRETYSQVIEYLGEFNSSSGIEMFKNLPFKFIEESIFSDINYRVSETVRAMNSFLEMYNDRDYLLTHKNYLKDVLNFNKLGSVDTTLNQSIEVSFSQFCTIADNLGVDYQDLRLKVNTIKKDISEKFEFITDSNIFISRYIDIENFLSFSLDDEEESQIFIDELLELKNEHTKTFDFIKNNPHFIFERDNNQNYLPELKYFENLIIELKNRIELISPESILSDSEIFSKKMNNLDNSELSNFIIEKEIEENLALKVKFTDSQSVQALFAFNDGSVSFKRSGIYKTLNDFKEVESFTKDIEESIILYQLRKKPQIAKEFLNAYRENSVFDMDEVLVAIDTYIENEQILKNMKFDFTMLRDSCFETFDDAMHAVVNKHKLIQYSNSILSNKYKNLVDDNVLASFKVLIESGVSKQSLQNIVGKKIAAMKSPEQLNEFLEKAISHFSGFSEEILIEKLNSLNITPVYNKNNQIVFEVNSFEESKILGSPSWCISRDVSYFESYTDEDCRQFFLYDFNKNEKDDESMIGFTLHKNGTLRTQHLKNDDYYYTDDYFDKLVNEIIYNNIEEFNLSEERKEVLNKLFGYKNNKQTIKIGNI